MSSNPSRALSQLSADQASLSTIADYQAEIQRLKQSWQADIDRRNQVKL